MAAKTCNVCFKRRVYTGTSKNQTIDPAPSGSDMCNFCYTEGGWENSHSDNDHENGGADDAEKIHMQDCWICHPELNLAQKEKKATSTGPKAQGIRRPQLNHKGHSHPGTPAARRACKLAFWASVAKQGVTPSTVLADHFVTWNHHCDSFGKPVEAPKKAPEMTVVPRGPKGGVINQLKAHQPK